MPIIIYCRCLFVAALLLVTSGCKNEPPPQSNLQPPVDQSLSHERLIELGMPAHDRNWSGADMATAANIIAKIVQKDATQLPRYQSQNSGQTFERITADDNLDLYRNRSLPLEQRLNDALNYTQATNQIYKLYLAAYNQRAVGDSDLIELAGSQLRETAILIELINEFRPTLDKNDPTYSVRMDGLKIMRKGMASIVTSNLQTLTESQFYRTSELKRLIGYMQSTFPDILPELPPGSQTEFLIRLRSYSNDPKMQHLKPELNQLVATVEKSMKTDKTP